MRDCDILELQSQGMASIYSEQNGLWRSVLGRKGYSLIAEPRVSLQILKI